jgi:hypothetical protein
MVSSVQTSQANIVSNNSHTWQNMYKNIICTIFTVHHTKGGYEEGLQSQDLITNLD